jgi:hypothetical protein
MPGSSHERFIHIWHDFLSLYLLILVL